MEKNLTKKTIQAIKELIDTECNPDQYHPIHLLKN